MEESAELRQSLHLGVRRREKFEAAKIQAGAARQFDAAAAKDVERKRNDYRSIRCRRVASGCIECDWLGTQPGDVREASSKREKL
jgi:hypothetical protein